MGVFDELLNNSNEPLGYRILKGIAGTGRSGLTNTAARIAVNRANANRRMSGIVKPPSVDARSIVSDVYKKSGRPDPYAKPQDPFSVEEIMRRLQELQDPSRYMDFSGLEEQARSSASAQYDPLIAALRNQMSSAEQRAGRNNQRLGEMFSSLSNSYQKDIPQIEQVYTNTKQNTQGAYDELKASIANQYKQTQQEQEELFNRLNIQAAAPDVLLDQQRDRDFFTNLASKEAQTAQTAIGMEERGATEYTRRGSDIARLEGTQRQADLMNQLEELLSQYGSQIGAHEAAREQSYLSNLSQLTGQVKGDAQKRAQQEFENYITSIRLGRDLRKDELGAGNDLRVKGLSDVGTRALNLGLPEIAAQRLQNTFNSAVGSDPYIQSGIDPDYGTSLSEEALAARVMEIARQRGLTNQELNAMQTIALEYFGRR